MIESAVMASSTPAAIARVAWPPLVMLLIIVLIAWQTAGRRPAIYVAVALTGLGLLSPEAWPLAMTALVTPT